MVQKLIWTFFEHSCVYEFTVLKYIPIMESQIQNWCIHALIDLEELIKFKLKEVNYQNE